MLVSAGVAWDEAEGRAYLDDLLEQLEDEAIEGSVLEASLLGLGQGSADGESNDNVIGVLLSAVVDRQWGS